LTYSTFEQQSPSVSQASNIFAVPFNNTRDFRVIDNRGCTSSWVSFTAPALPSEIATTATSGSCIVRGVGSWWHVTDASNNVIVSIDDNNNDLGAITAWSYVEPVTSYYNQTYYMKRHFRVHSDSTFANPVTLRLYFTDSELNDLITNSKLNQNVEDDVNSISDLKITRYSGANEDNNYANNDFVNGSFVVYTPTTGSSDLLYLGDHVQYVEITVPGFSEQWIHGGTNNTSILPVELVSFKPECLGNNVLVRWVTASEVNNSHFNLERSINGVDFVYVARIQGSGNSNGIIEYSYIDNYDATSQVYYRLVQVDYDGASRNYDSKAVKCESNLDKVVVQPNPFKNSISINGLHEVASTFEITDAMGQIVYKESRVASANETINLTSLAPGLYTLNVIDINGNSRQFKIVKN
jgi:hypothetical protein